MPKKGKGVGGLDRKKADPTAVEKRVVILDQEKCKPNSAAFAYLQRWAGGDAAAHAGGSGCLVTVDALFGTAVAQLEGADSPVPARAARTAVLPFTSALPLLLYAPRAVAKHGGGRAAVAQRMRAMHQIRQPSKMS